MDLQQLWQPDGLIIKLIHPRGVHPREKTHVRSGDLDGSSLRTGSKTHRIHRTLAKHPKIDSQPGRLWAFTKPIHGVLLWCFLISILSHKYCRNIHQQNSLLSKSIESVHFRRLKRICRVYAFGLFINQGARGWATINFWLMI